MALPKIDVPIYETKLISNAKVVKFRPFLVKEQKLFLMATESDDIKEQVNTIKQILNNCILTEIDIDNLPTFDLEHLFMQLRARSVGEVVNLKYTCNNEVTGEDGEKKKCGGTVKFDLNLLEVKPTVDEGHDKKIQLTPKFGVIMKYPSFSSVDVSEITSENELEKTIEMIASCIDMVYDEDNLYYSKDVSKEELVDFVENLQQDDLDKIQKFFLTMPKIKKELDFTCPKCGYVDKVEVEGIQNFFV